MFTDQIIRVGVIVAAIGGLIMALYQTLKVMYQASIVIHELHDDMIWMKKQLQPNAGKSLRDAVDRNAATIKSLEEAITRNPKERTRRGDPEQTCGPSVSGTPI